MKKCVWTGTATRFLGILIRRLNIYRSLITAKRKFLSSARAIRLCIGRNARIEDKPEWYEKFAAEFSAPNWEMRYCDEKQGYEDMIFADGEKYDVVVVDGKRRAECAANAVKALAAGGLVILDDSDRINTSLEYFNAVKYLREANLLQVDFYGFCPMNNYTKATSLFFSRDFDFKSLYEVQPINGWGNIWSMSRKERKGFFKKQDYPLAEEKEDK